MNFVIKITLKGISDPTIWRRVAVPDHLNFHQLHQVIQVAMGWRDSHLYCFTEHKLGDLITITSPYDEEFGIDARKVPIDKILLGIYNSGVMDGPRTPLTYIYDYGDHWVHEIDVEEVRSDELVHCELLEGEGSCPPEDCGGLHGFMDIKESLRTGAPSKIHGDSYLPWLNGTGYKNYNPTVFDLRNTAMRVGAISIRSKSIRGKRLG